MPPEKVTVEKLVYGGEGLAHANGETVFVPFVLTGEEAEVEITERKKKLARARVARVLSPSPARILPRCPHFGACGGCDYQHTSYDEQLRIKESILHETLRRIGRIDWKSPITSHKSPPWEYRNRAQWKVQPVGGNAAHIRDTPHKSNIGYFRARSSALCPIEVCHIISPKLFETFTQIREALASGNLPSELREVEAFANATGTELLLNVTCSSLPRNREALLDKLAELIPAAASILLQDSAGSQMALHGPGFLQYNALGKSFRVAHLSFFQVNRFLLEDLACTVSNLAGTGSAALDLYAGVGLFTLSLAEKFASVATVESHPVAARDLEINAGASGKSIAIHNQPVKEFMHRRTATSKSSAPDVVVADPPRAGLDDGVAEQLARLSPPRIVYVSCDPATLARDLATLRNQAYTLREIHLFDMFPQTYHIESVALLERAR